MKARGARRARSGPAPANACPMIRGAHVCAVTFISDMGSGFSELDAPDVPPGGVSLDHSVWFHRAVRADEWLYNDLGPISASGARGVYRGHIYDEAGRLGATLVQEMLLRPDAPYWNRRPG